MIASTGLAALGSALARWWADAWRWAVTAAGLVVGLYLMLERGIGAGVTGAAALGLLLIGAVLTRRVPLAIPLIATPALFVVQRIGIGETDLTASDVALAAGFASALLLGDRAFSRPLRALLLLNAVYQFATLFTVIVNPQTQNTVEWFHAWLLISGSVIMGWALGRAGFARAALLMIVIAGIVIAVGTIVTAIGVYLQREFVPIYPAFPWPMHKNFAGTAMAFSAAVAFLRPDWARLPTGWMRVSFWVLLVAITMTQARQALVGLAAVIVIAALRPVITGRSRWYLMLIVPATWLIVSLVLDQIDSQNQHNSVFQRLEWLREVYAYWKHAPVFGHGLRFWYTDPALPYQPPQAELEVLASAGAVGLAGFAVMWIGVIVVLWRIDPRYGTLALALPLSRLTQAQFDLFWVAVQTSIPFVVTGICLGAMALHTAEQTDQSAEIEPRMRQSALRTRMPASVNSASTPPTVSAGSTPRGGSG